MRLRLDGRLILLVLAVAFLLFQGWALKGPTEWEAGWNLMGIPPEETPYCDLVNVLSAAESRDHGYDPLVENPWDPYLRPMPYPRAWIFLGSLVPPPWPFYHLLALAIISLFLITLLLALPPLGLGEGALMAPLVFAPPLFLGAERCNNDLVVFMLVGAALLLLRRPWPTGGGAYLLLLGGAVLKFYPLLMAAVAVREGRRRAALVFVSLGALFILYAVATWGDILQIGRSLEPGLLWSYGASIIPYWFDESLREGSRLPSLLMGLLPALPLAAGAWWLARGEREALHLDPPGDPARGDGLLAGGAFFLGTWLMGTHFNYKLLFLLPALPGVMAMARGKGRRALLSRAALAALTVFFWGAAFAHWLSPLMPSWIDLARAVLGYLLVGYFAYALLLALPSWCRPFLGLPPLAPAEVTG